MARIKDAPRTERLYVVVTPQEKALVEKAAVADDRSISDFVRKATIDAAQRLMSRWRAG